MTIDQMPHVGRVQPSYWIYDDVASHRLSQLTVGNDRFDY